MVPSTESSNSAMAKMAATGAGLPSRFALRNAPGLVVPTQRCLTYARGMKEPRGLSTFSEVTTALEAALGALPVGDLWTCVQIGMPGERVLLARRARPNAFTVEATGLGLEVLAQHGFTAPRSGWSRFRRTFEGPVDLVAADLVVLVRSPLEVADPHLVVVTTRPPLARGALVAMLLTFAVVFGLPLCLEVAEAWPASWLIGLQARWFNGHYYPKATYRALLVLEALPVVLFLLLMSALARVRARQKA